MDKKYNELDIMILNKIQNASKQFPVKGKVLCDEFNLSFRNVKAIITKLREDYPIVSKQTNGGGYWISEDETDILNFINMINARKIGYEETINKMNTHLKNI